MLKTRVWRLVVVAIVVAAPTTARAITITEIIDSTGDGAGNLLDIPIDVAVDSLGNVYVTGYNSDNVFRITPGGVITEIIDTSGDGAGNTLVSPIGVAVDDSGNVYVTGEDSDNVFRITPGGVITEIIDSSGDGAGNPLDRPQLMATDGLGNVYVTGFDSNNAFKITPSGVISEIIDSSGDGAGNTLAVAVGIAIDGSGNVYVTGAASDNVFRITPCEVITEIIDSNPPGFGTTLAAPLDIAVDGSDNVYVTGVLSDNAFKITPIGVITEIIDSTGDGAGNLLAGSLGIAVDGSGNVYVTGADSDNVFRITPGGVITQIIDSTGDGAGNVLNAPIDVAVDGLANVYVTARDTDNAFKFSLELVLQKSAAPNPVASGGVLAYTLTVTNTSGQTLNGVSLSDVVPALTTYQAGSASNGGSEAGGVVTWPAITLGPGLSAVRSFEVIVDPGLVGSVVLFSDDMEMGNLNWTPSHPTGSIDWLLVGSNPHSGFASWFGDDVGVVSDQLLTLTVPVVPLSGATLEFFHEYATEPGFDGGVVEVSTDGAVWSDLGASALENGYNAGINTCCSSPIGGRQAFTGFSGGFIRSRFDLVGFVGLALQVRFRMATDESLIGAGWWIDDVEIATPDVVIQNNALVTSAEGPSASDSTQTFVLGTASADADSDGVLDGADNCPFVPNGAAETTGQPAWGGQAESTQYPGVGCACLCGDPNRDCLVNVGDAPEAQRAGLIPPLPPLSPFFDIDFCDINGDAVCNVGDAPDMQRAGLFPPLPPLSPSFDVTSCIGYQGLTSCGQAVCALGEVCCNPATGLCVPEAAALPCLQ